MSAADAIRILRDAGYYASYSMGRLEVLRPGALTAVTLDAHGLVVDKERVRELVAEMPAEGADAA